MPTFRLCPVNALLKANAPTIVVATRSPYDLLAFPDGPTYLAIYGANLPMIEALDVLTGNISARGKLPVALPSLYQVGDGVR